MSRPQLPKWLAVMLLTIALGGCSIDRRVFHSSPDLPLNYTLLDVSSGQTIWSMEVPVLHKLVVDLDRDDEVEIARVSGRPATSMRWYLYSVRPSRKIDEGKIKLQGMPIVQNISYRPGPELPADYIAPGMEDVGEGLFAPGAAPEGMTPAEHAAPGLTDDLPPPPESEMTPESEMPAIEAEHGTPPPADTAVPVP